MQTSYANVLTAFVAMASHKWVESIAISAHFIKVYIETRHKIEITIMRRESTNVCWTDTYFCMSCPTLYASVDIAKCHSEGSINMEFKKNGRIIPFF